MASDVFSDFVDVLTDLIDRHDVGATAFAERLHFSRFHLDRLISQVSGEPPQRFRRRILLERSAYRLLSTQRSVLDVAVEAGYGSHEAFARAFRRAYGVAPAEFRRQRPSSHIPAPSGVHFHPPGSIRLPAREEVTDMELLTRMVDHHVWLTGRSWSGLGRCGPTSSTNASSQRWTMTRTRPPCAGCSRG